MLYQVFDPLPMLAPFVQFFWALEADVASGDEFVHRSMADVGVEMVFHYRAKFDEITDAGTIDTSPLASIQAQSTQFRRFTTGESFGIFGAYLYPFAIPRFFSLPARDFTNISPDLESVLGQAGRRLDQMMVEADSNERRVEIISEFLCRRLDSNSRELDNIHRAVHTIREAKSSVNILQLAREYTLSTRQFERRFKEIAGLTPNLLACSPFSVCHAASTRRKPRPHRYRVFLRLLRPIPFHQ